MDIFQHRGSPLHNILMGCLGQQLAAPGTGQDRSPGNFAFQFIPPDIGELDGAQHIDLIDHIPQPRMPEYGLHQSPGRRWRHHIVAHPLPLQFRPGKTGILPPAVDSYSITHGTTSVSR